MSDTVMHRNGALASRWLSDDEAYGLADLPVAALMPRAAVLRDAAHADRVSFSRKVFIPLTQLCRDSCHYCTFAHPPRRGEPSFLSRDEVLEIARAGVGAGCREALFTLGDKPELRYRAAREELEGLGHADTLSYLAEMAELVIRKTGLLPHINAGVMPVEAITRLRRVSVSQGLMLEGTAPQLSQRGGPHYGSPDKEPAARLRTIAAAGEARVPFTSGLLIGIGETRRDRLEALLELRALHRRFGHIQEIIIQNFRAKPGTRMAESTEPPLEEHLWTIAAARIIFGAEMNIQAPPNLSAGTLEQLIAAGINDWGGISPVTRDHVNPECPWPEVEALRTATQRAGKTLVERIAIFPAFVAETGRWLDPSLQTATMRAVDATGYAREDSWIAGGGVAPQPQTCAPAVHSTLFPILARAEAGLPLTEDEVSALFVARGSDEERIKQCADTLRASVNGDEATYVVTRNINYTNICSYRCGFCAFSKGRTSAHRGPAYDLDLSEIADRAREAWDRGAVELCLQGGIHPRYTGETYLEICRTVKRACPEIHIHAFSPLEVSHGAATLGISVRDFLADLKAAGLGSLPGTAAEILDDEVRRIICPDKLSTAAWLQVMETAHELGVRSTATIMFGHVDSPRHWARHLLRLRQLQERTGGFTELVPLPFVPMETPIHLRGRSRLGPTFREAVLMHSVARLVLHGLVPNIQASWVKMGRDGLLACLRAGANDLGGTLMNESITRAAGAVHGQEMPPQELEMIARELGRRPRQRTTLYAPAPPERIAASMATAPLVESVPGRTKSSHLPI